MKYCTMILLFIASLILSGCTVWESTDHTYYVPPTQDLELDPDAWHGENDSQHEAGF